MAGFPSRKKGNLRGESPVKQPRPGVPLDKNVMLDLIAKHSGNLSRVADAMGSNRYVIRRRCDADKELGEALENARERKIDELEECVWVRAKKSQDTALQLFLLKTQARHRGYDQDEAKHTAKDIASAAFDFILSKSKPSP